MLFKNVNSIDDEETNKKKIDFSKYKTHLIISIIVLLLIVFLVIIIKSLNNYNGSIGNIISKRDEVITYNINLLGDNEITLYQGDEYIEPGYKGYDNKNNNLTNKVIVNNMVDTSQVGSYEISYSLDNTVKKRIINVIEKPIGATYIHLLGDMTIYLDIGNKYIEPGYEVIDTVDGGKLKEKVNVINNIDTSKAGTYRVTYSVVNSSGVTSSKSRTVIVMDSEISLTLSSTEYTNKEVSINIYVNDNYFNYMILPNGNKITDKSYSYKVSENGTYKVSVYNKKGTKKDASITISNINKTSPNGSCSGYYQDGTSVINIKATDDIGVSRYVLNNNAYTSSPIKVNSEIKEAKITIYDKAGNTKIISCNLEDKNVYGKVKNISSYEPKKLNNNVYLSYYKPSSGKGFSYWIYLPDKVTANLPIIIYLHGLGEIGDDYNNNTKSALANGPIHEVVSHGYSYNAIIIHAQVLTNCYVYEFLPSYVELLNKTADEYKANKKKISIMGFSHGCYGVMNMIPKYQTYFSAAVPIGCDPKDRAKYFVSTPTWAFAGGGDGVSTMPGFVNQINSMGGTSKFNRPPFHQHNVIGDEYSILRDDNYNVIDWMISQTRK